MSVLKVRCPECDAAIRQTIDAVDEPTDFTLTCPKCQAEFVAEAQPERAPAKQPAKKPIKATKSRDDDEDEEDDAPRKGKKKAAGGANTKLLVGGIAAGLLLIGGIVAAVAMSGGDGDKKQDQAKADPAPQQPTDSKGSDPVPQPEQKKQSKQRPKDVNPPKKSDPNPITKAKDKDDEVLIQVDPSLPAPPKVPRSGKAPTGGGKLDAKVESAPAFVPIAKDQDPFLRARNFAPDGPVPPLAKLPPAAQRPILTLDPRGHSAFVKNVFFTPKGDQVITVGSDKAVRIWDIKTGEPIHTIRLPAGPGEEGSLDAAALSSTGKRLAVAGVPLKAVRAGQIPIFILNIENGTLVKTISGARQDVRSLDFSPDGTRLAVGCVDGSIQVFNVASGSMVSEIPNQYANTIREVRFNPNPGSKLLATLAADGAVRIWDLSTRRSSNLSLGAIGANGLDWASTGQTLAVGGKSGDIMLFSPEGRLIRSLPRLSSSGEPIQISRLQFIAGDHELVVGGVGGPTLGWAGVIAVETGTLKVTMTEHSNSVFAVNASADGKFAVTSGGNQNETYVWNVEDGKIISRLCGTGKGVWGVGWAKDGRSVAFGAINKADDDENNPLEAVFRFDDMGPAALQDSTKYQQTIKADSTYGIKRVTQTDCAILNTTTKRLVPYQLIVPPWAPQTIYSATVLPGKRMVIFCGVKHLVGVDPETGKIIKEFKGHSGNILSVAPSPDGRYFVTGSSDQTIRIWTPNSEDPYLSICVAGREWIAWTPEGYYSCSPHGEQLIAWQINSGANKFPQVHPAARFRPSMYQPALIKYLIPAGSMPLAMAMAKKYDKVLLQTTSVADIIPPEIAIESPLPDTGVVDQETFTVKAVATGLKQPITAMRLLMDGRPYQGPDAVKKFDKPEMSAEASWEVPLTPGQHTFAVIAETSVSRGMSKLGMVTRSGTPPKPNLYVLTMGISKYTGDVNPLRYCASDAVLLGKAFPKLSKGVFDKIEVKVLIDEQATKQGMRDGMDWLKSKMTPQDIGVVAFSGHGSKDLFDRFFLVPYGFEGKNAEQTGFSGDEFRERLEKIPGRIVAILDACHSGSVTGGAAPARADNLVRDLASEDAGVIVMCASLGSEVSWESPLTKAGLFTLGLVEGLSGHADIDEDGLIYIHELDTYAAARALQLCKFHGFTDQNSTTGRPPGIRPFPIASVDKPIKPKEKDKDTPMPKEKDKESPMPMGKK